MPSRHMENRTPDMSRHYIGIDPGANGGIAWTSPLGDKSAPLPKTLGDLTGLIFDILMEQDFWTRGSEPSRFLAVVESPPKFVKVIPGSAVYVMARNFGNIEGILAAYRVPTQLVTPQAWQKAQGLGTSKGMTKTEWKNKLKGRAQSLYPEEHVTLATADALLILNAACHKSL
jgi:hypothetical protein